MQHRRLVSTPGHDTELQNQAHAFFASLLTDKKGRRLLTEQDHSIEFDIEDGQPFRVCFTGGRIQLKTGIRRPRRYDINDLIHFQLRAATLAKLFKGKIRFTDSLIPTVDGKDRILLLECTLFKWSVLSWVGRLFREAQLRTSRSL